MEAICRETVIDQLNVVEIETIIKGLELLEKQSREKASREKKSSDGLNDKNKEISILTAKLHEQDCESIKKIINKFESEISKLPF